MDNYRIRKLEFNNKNDFNLYIKLKSLFLSELEENNSNFKDIFDVIRFKSNMSAYANKVIPDTPFFPIKHIDIFVLERNNNNTLEIENYTPIAYTSISTKLYGKNNNWDIKPKETFEIENFFVLPEYRLNSKALDLLKYAIKYESERNKKTAIFNVLSTNSNKYFHFALADFIMSSQTISNGIHNTNIMYLHQLCCEDVNKILNISTKELLKKVFELQHEQTYENTDIPLSLIEDLNVDLSL